MTQFRYEAYAAQGQVLKGTIEAGSLAKALSLLNQKGLQPYLTEPETNPQTEKRSFFSFGGVGLEWRARFVRQLATLMAAGITLDRALLILTQQAQKKSERTILESTRLAVINGKSLSEALSFKQSVFQPDEIGLVKASEQTGSTVPILNELASLLERRMQIRSKIASALVYPAFLLTLAPVSLLIIATVLVPNLAPLFENSGAAMPFALQSMIWLSTEFRERGPIWLVAFIGAVAIAVWLSKLKSVSSLWNRVSIGLPFVGVIKRKNEAARICRTLGSLIRSGAALQTALQAIVDVIGTPATQEKLREVRNKVSAGGKLGEALKLIPSIDSSSLQMIAIGEETNKLDTMLLHVAETEEQTLSAYIDRLMTLLTPLITIVLGLFVGGIVMSIMRAILSVNDLVGK
jgi:general secretion pathway protein F